MKIWQPSAQTVTQTNSGPLKNKRNVHTEDTNRHIPSNETFPFKQERSRKQVGQNHIENKSKDSLVVGI